MTTKSEIRELWKTCFNDPEEFIDLYFSRRYSDDINVDIRKDGRVVSALQMIPYDMTFFNATIKVAYVSGACTHPDYRKQGFMRRLLTEAHRKIRANDALFSTLIPAEDWLFHYYQVSGYASVFKFATEKLSLDSFLFDYERNQWNKKYHLICSKCNPDVFNYLNRALRSRPCCIQHSYNDFQDIISDLFLDKGLLLTVKQQSETVGLVMTVYKGNDLLIKELLFDNEEVKITLLAGVAMHFRIFNALWIRPSANADGVYGMARLLDVEKAYAIYAKANPKENFSFYITEDKDIPVNEGIYIISAGEVKHSHQDKPIGFPFTIEKATAYLFRKNMPYMSLMMD
ncbi:MAG: GNAT family N-acetyltransferase [Phocaeicola sp.]|uniref:GNAT family N-acetyltransferase n=1 Tax=Phocaeicola TaxID=909656 RepID=UPI00234F7253|nr:GNAT family N-acetyltransferase [Phocaeicola oris]MCE2615888.1 GNAT family N-acetyltransferase [Phocaeicola oris]